jgi:hypothetical protein
MPYGVQEPRQGPGAKLVDDADDFGVKNGKDCGKRDEGRGRNCSPPSPRAMPRGFGETAFAGGDSLACLAVTRWLA